MRPIRANIRIFLTPLPRMTKSQEIFKLRSLCHVAVREEESQAKLHLPEFLPCLG
jgi:hypothetical protein